MKGMTMERLTTELKIVHLNHEVNTHFNQTFHRSLLIAFTLVTHHSRTILSL